MHDEHEQFHETDICFDPHTYHAGFSCKPGIDGISTVGIAKSFSGFLPPNLLGAKSCPWTAISKMHISHRGVVEGGNSAVIDTNRNLSSSSCCDPSPLTASWSMMLKLSKAEHFGQD